MHFLTVLYVFFFSILAQASVIPLEKRDVPPTAASFAGSASVQWLDSSNNVKIRTFYVRQNGALIMSSYNGPTPGWSLTDLGKTVNGGTLNAISAVSLRPNTPTHAIHLYYTVGSDKSMKSLVVNVADNNLSDDNNFNNLNIKGVVPRAAITWNTPGQTYPQVRVYFIRNTAVNYDKFQCELSEVAFDNGWSAPKVIIPFKQVGEGSFSDSLAAISVVRGGHRETKLYFYNEDYFNEFTLIGEYQWMQGQIWEQVFDENNLRFPISAVSWDQANGLQIRIYRHLPKKVGKNQVHEYSWDGGKGAWSDKDLPNAIITDTQGIAQMSAVQWLNPDKSIHIRLYQWKNDSPRAVIAESSFDSPTWTANTAKL